MEITVRKIQPEDNVAMALVLRNSLKEFGLDIPGTAYFDESTDHLYESFQQEGSAYFIAIEDNTVIGGVGIYPSDGLPEGTVELVKMYLVPQARGKGLGKMLMKKCIALAEQMGYTKIYLESMPELKEAVSAYKKLGFKMLEGPVGCTGHFSCTVWMIYEIPASKS
jgi:putative acetyltransferase